MFTHQLLMHLSSVFPSQTLNRSSRVFQLAALRLELQHERHNARDLQDQVAAWDTSLRAKAVAVRENTAVLFSQVVQRAHERERGGKRENEKDGASPIFPASSSQY